ncbi:restriction endonuclease subunit S [Streptomyces mayteni]
MSPRPETPTFQVGEVGEVRMGKQLSPSARASKEQFPYLRVANVFEGRIDYSDVKTMGFSPTERTIYALKPGDILLNEGQESLSMVGRSAIYDGPAERYCFQNTLIRFRPGPQLIAEYAQLVFTHWRRTGVFARTAEKTSISHLGGSRFAALAFPLPPLDDQRRIVEALSSLIESEQTTAASMEKMKTIRHATIEELTRTSLVRLKSVILKGPQNGLYKPASAYGISGTPIVRISSFTGGPSDFSQGLLRVSTTDDEIQRYGLSVGDLIINRVNSLELVGKATCVSRISEPTVFESNNMRCKLDHSQAAPKFAEAWLMSSAARRHFLQHAKSAVSQASIGQQDVDSCPFPALGVEEQGTFLGRLETVDTRLRAEHEELSKLRLLKQGLADDLLTGRVSVRSLG